MSRNPFVPWLFLFAFFGIALVALRSSPNGPVAAQPHAEFIEFLVPAATWPAGLELHTVIFLDDQGGVASLQPAYALRKVSRTDEGLTGSVTDVLPTQKVPPGTRLGTIVGGELVVIGSGEGYQRYRRYVGTIL
jgi:hypothetical protein